MVLSFNSPPADVLPVLKRTGTPPGRKCLGCLLQRGSKPLLQNRQPESSHQSNRINPFQTVSIRDNLEVPFHFFGQPDLPRFAESVFLRICHT